MSTEADADRVMTQTRYFDLPSPAATLGYGRLAAKFTAEHLRRPFTVFTAFTDAMGRPRSKRFYCFVITAKGEDLATLLVRNGLARNFGYKTTSPDGIPPDEMVHILQKYENTAKQTHVEAWARSGSKRSAKKP